MYGFNGKGKRISDIPRINSNELHLNSNILSRYFSNVHVYWNNY